jgi:hypothetical protein
MVITKITNGMGNQMFQYAAARAHAARNKTTVRLDLMWFLYNKARKYGLSCFNLSGKRASLVQILYLRGMTMKDWKQSIASDRLSSTHYIERSLSFDPTVLKLPKKVYLQGYFQSERYFVDQEQAIREDFRFLLPLPNSCQSVLAKVLSTDSISMHIRRTDYLTVGLDQYVLSMNYYARALEHICTKLAEPHVFVFSDDPNWALANLRLQIPMIIVSNSQMHDYEELQLMSMCKHHIVANSSFSWWGAWLASGNEKIVIAPEHWMAEHSEIDSRDLVPTNWTRM